MRNEWKWHTHPLATAAVKARHGCVLKSKETVDIFAYSHSNLTSSLSEKDDNNRQQWYIAVLLHIDAVTSCNPTLSNDSLSSHDQYYWGAYVYGHFVWMTDLRLLKLLISGSVIADERGTFCPCTVLSNITLRLRQMADSFQPTLSNPFSWMKMNEFRLSFCTEIYSKVSN